MMIYSVESTAPTNQRQYLLVKLVHSHKLRNVVLLHAELSLDKMPNKSQHVIFNGNFESCSISCHGFNEFKSVLLSRNSRTESLLVMQSTEGLL